MGEEEIFRTYTLLSRIEDVFKELKGPIKTRRKTGTGRMRGWRHTYFNVY